MRIALCSSVSPFVKGGARNIVEWLEIVLRHQGHDVERVYIPHVDSPRLLIRQMAAYRWIDLESADRVVAFRPPAHVIRHPRKVVWFIHHIRQFYDLWDTAYRSFPDDQEHQGIRSTLHAVDTLALEESIGLFANSRVVAERLARFNGVKAEVLYPPILMPERFSFAGLNDEIVAVSRLVPHKRQHLLVEAMKFTTTGVKLRLHGASRDASYANELRNQIRLARLEEKVTIDDRWISESEKVRILASCLAHAYVPVDEDSYGYPTLEAAHSGKTTLTTTDSGGVLEFVEDGVTGRVVEPKAPAIADAMDALFRNRTSTKSLGQNARERIGELQISWSHVLDRLLA